MAARGHGDHGHGITATVFRISYRGGPLLLAQVHVHVPLGVFGCVRVRVKTGRQLWESKSAESVGWAAVAVHI